MLSSCIRVISAAALLSISLSPTAFAAGVNHASLATMQRANGPHDAKKQKCVSAFQHASAAVKAQGKKTFMTHCMNVTR
jgi:hypothetical protein